MKKKAVLVELLTSIFICEKYSSQINLSNHNYKILEYNEVNNISLWVEINHSKQSLKLKTRNLLGKKKF